MKALLLSLGLVFTISSAVAGPSVSGGIVYEQKLEQCQNSDQEANFTLKAIMNPSTFYGFLSQGESYNTLKCIDGSAIRNTGDPIIWICTEQRVGEGRIVIEIRMTSAGVKYANFYRYDILQRLQKLYEMTCDQQVSN
jgi:hypothetical protein